MPPVATTRALPPSSFLDVGDDAGQRADIVAAHAPDCIERTVVFADGVLAAISTRAVGRLEEQRLHRDLESGKIAPPRYAPSASMASNVVAVPMSTMMSGLP